MQCSAWVVLGTSSWAATDAFPVFAKMSPNASVAPAAVTSTFTRGPSRIR